MNRVTQTVLVVDDSADDLILLRKAFQKVAPEINFRTASNGQQALDYLQGRGEFSDRERHPWPTWMLLDLKMPKIDGFEVIARLQAAGLPRPPHIIVLSSSALEKDMTRARDMGAELYEVKPVAFEELCARVQKMADFFQFLQ